jgi:HSP20 family protein
MAMRLHPWAEFTRIFDEMDRVFHDTSEGGRVTPRSRSYRPAIDLYDTGEEFVVHALIPGTSPENLNVSMEQNALHINGTWGYQLPEDEAKHVTWYRREIGSGQFAHTVNLPAPVDSDNAEANFEWGVLTLKLPKAEQARTKRIEVRTPKALTS